MPQTIRHKKNETISRTPFTINSVSFTAPFGSLDANQYRLTKGVLASKIRNEGIDGWQNPLKVIPNTVSAAPAWNKYGRPNMSKWNKQQYSRSHTKYPQVSAAVNPAKS
ncbi:hypothetical protein OGATHE_006715 [Ogataea polymorpha]|uniref:Uncharacterized protein n=1 Tax=Ogataea polymorpha TaxID=460523 RepID=A0A9P8NTA9_9ASCO|nr:hypothetical protein OGATHE_006715 [Ogataea polymorpha]